MMIEPDDKTDYHNDKPVKRYTSAETISKQQQNSADFVYHSPPPIMDRIDIDPAASAENENFLFRQHKGIGGRPLKLMTGFDLFNQNRDDRIPLQVCFIVGARNFDDLVDMQGPSGTPEYIFDRIDL